jgi:acetyl esterase/lipase
MPFHVKYIAGIGVALMLLFDAPQAFTQPAAAPGESARGSSTARENRPAASGALFDTAAPGGPGAGGVPRGPGGRGGVRGNGMVGGPNMRDDVPRIKLYEKTPGVASGNDTEMNPMEPTLDLYLPEEGKATGAGVLICPGGGYSMLTLPGEGPAPARFFLQHNIAAFVLRYRHGPTYHYPTTLLDAQRAMRLIRARAKEYRVDPDKIGVFGGSAGGHLAAMVSTMHGGQLLPEAPYQPDATDALSAKPAFTLLLYPVIDFTDDAVTHRGSRTNLTRDNKDLYEALSPWKQVTRETPPAFIIHGTNDMLVPVKNALLYYEACKKAGVSVEMHLPENAQHGFGLGTNLTDETVKEWPVQALRFMARHRMIPAAGP